MKITSDHCVGCGACCADGRLVHITKRDKKRLPDAKLDVASPKLPQLRYAAWRFGDMMTEVSVMLGRYDGQEYLKKSANHRCVYLRGRVGKDAHCSVYEQRPSMCRTLKPGSSACIHEREKRGLPT